MLNSLEPDQRALADYMSELSEEAYCAGWMSGLEYVLWYGVQTGPMSYGRLDITDEHIKRMRMLCDQCGGWIVFDDVHEETWVPTHRWESMYAAWKPQL